MLATHAAVALIATDDHNQFESALAGRDIIGQAKGILMERFKIGAVHAFVILTRLSQETNTPVRTLAARLGESLEVQEAGAALVP
jgi:AmiR/NasT family two-component response regulator